MYHRNVTAISAALVFTLAAAGAVAQGLPDQGEGMVDGEFLKPPASSFVSTSDWEYRFSDPGSGWEAVPSGGSGWSQTALLGFHGGGTMPGDVGSFESWPAGQSTLWARTTFTVGAEDLDDVMFWGRWDDDITVYVNGVLAVERDEWTPSNRYLGLSEAARLTLTASQPNLLAVRVTNTDGGRHMNLQPVVAPDLAQLPVWGSVKNDDVVHLVGFVRAQMLQHGVPAGALSIFEADGVNENNYTELVNVGIGYMDKQFQRQVSPETPFRLASLDKHPVKAAIEDLVDAGILAWNDNVWNLLAQSGVTAINGTTDSTAATYTLADIYNRNATLVGYPWDANFFASLGVTEDTITEADLMSWMFSTPTDGDSCYNPCSEVLRYLVNSYTPMGLEAYFTNEWNADFFFAGGKVENRTFNAQGELSQPWYVTLQDTDEFDYQFDAIRVLASTARDNSLFWIQNNTPENYGLVWYGGMGGSQTFVRGFRAADNSRHLYVTALFNLPGMTFGNAPLIDGTLQHLVANLPTSAYTTDAPISWEPGTTGPDGNVCFVDADCNSGSCDGGVCVSDSGSSTPCESPITLSPTATGTGNFGTTGALCYRIERTLNGMGVSNMKGRNLFINDIDMAGQCPAEHGNCSMPLPAPIDGYHYFEASAGDFPWANLYWW